MAEEKKSLKPRAQRLILENRERLSVSGVIDVDSFNENMIIVETELGVLSIKGEDLHMSKLSLDSSELNVEGDIISLEYSDADRLGSKGMGFFTRLFR